MKSVWAFEMFCFQFVRRRWYAINRYCKEIIVLVKIDSINNGEFYCFVIEIANFIRWINDCVVISLQDFDLI